MTNSVKTLIVDICNHKPSPHELENLVQLIEQELELMTTSNYAKKHNISFNGAKKHRHYISIGGIKFHSDGYTKNEIPL